MTEPGEPTLVEALRPEAQAILSLILTQGQSYSEIAEVLGLDVGRVRQRAHEAVDLLAPGGPLRPQRARITDYLLGELPVSERFRARAELADAPDARAWAQRVVEAVAPLAATPLPAIPDPAANAQANAAPSPADAPDPPSPLCPPPPMRLSGQQLQTPRHRRWIVGTAVVSGLVLAAVIVLVVTGGGSSRRAPASAGKVQSAGRTVRHLVLAPAGNDRKAVGEAAIVRQKKGMVLLLQGRGLPANRDDFYGVWLVNSAADAHLLGFISPAVGASGTFSSGASLPDDAVRYHELVITVETTSQPPAPGPPILHSALSLS